MNKFLIDSEERYNDYLNNYQGIKTLEWRINKDIPYLPEGLKELTCCMEFYQFSNISPPFLTFLPPLPKSLRYLDCSYNKLTSLPSLPESLTYLICSCNYLTSLPELPENLDVLCCRNNKLTSLPNLPKNLTHLQCWHNNLLSLPPLPSSLQKLFFDFNHNLFIPFSFSISDNNSVIYYPSQGVNKIPLIKRIQRKIREKLRKRRKEDIIRKLKDIRYNINEDLINLISEY